MLKPYEFILITRFLKHWDKEGTPFITMNYVPGYETFFSGIPNNIRNEIKQEMSSRGIIAGFKYPSITEVPLKYVAQFLLQKIDELEIKI